MTRLTRKLHLALLVALALVLSTAPVIGTGAAPAPQAGAAAQAGAPQAGAAASQSGYKPLFDFLDESHPLRKRLVAPMNPRAAMSHSPETLAEIDRIASNLSKVTDFNLKQTFIIDNSEAGSREATEKQKQIQSLYFHLPGRASSQLASASSIICEGINSDYFGPGWLGKGFYFSPNANKCLIYATSQGPDHSVSYRTVAYLLAIAADVRRVHYLADHEISTDTEAGPPDGYDAVTGTPRGGREYMVSDPRRLHVVALFCLSLKPSSQSVVKYFPEISASMDPRVDVAGNLYDATIWVQNAATIVKRSDPQTRFKILLGWLKELIPTPTELYPDDLTDEDAGYLANGQKLMDQLIATVNQVKVDKTRKSEKEKLEPFCRFTSFVIRQTLARANGPAFTREQPPGQRPSRPLYLPHFYQVEVNGINENRGGLLVATERPPTFSNLSEDDRARLSKVQSCGSATLSQLEEFSIKLARYNIALLKAKHRQNPAVLDKYYLKFTEDLLIEPRLFDWRVWYLLQPSKDVKTGAPLKYAQACETQFRDRLGRVWEMFESVKGLHAEIYGIEVDLNLQVIWAKLIEMNQQVPFPEQAELIEQPPADELTQDDTDSLLMLLDSSDLPLHLHTQGDLNDGAAAASVAAPGTGSAPGEAARSSKRLKLRNAAGAN